ncbi:MAG TPA: hypothetical protein VK463_05850 [Desulfomonilaceae bacterium]|nr:hypothetical protein [Desulfomonilaceae bacterium]
MEIPEKIAIFGRMYNIRDLSPMHVSEGVIGMAAYTEGTIYMDRSVDTALFLSTLWHEAVHIAQQDLLGTIDEAQARWIALFVHNLLVQNPSVLECYRRTEDERQDS